MAFEHPGGASLDYKVCRYGKSRLLVRGPKARLKAPYTLFFGGTETYGRFVARPFPTRIAEGLALRCANISAVNAGLDAFVEDQTLLSAASKAERVVVQVLGAANLSNDFYSVHPRRNDRFIAASPALQELYPEVDFTEFSFTKHLLTSLERRCADRFTLVVEELKLRWRLQMHRLLSEANGRCLLLWIAKAPPPREAVSVRSGADPLLVDTRMLADIGATAREIVQVIPSKAAIATGTQGMVFSEFEAHVAALTINDATHAEIAAALRPVLQRQIAAA
ncbi:MAG: DUF6473 family protein [Pseudomonadota bacterium]